MSDDAELWRELERLGEDPLPGERSDADIVAAALSDLTTGTTTHQRAASAIGVGAPIAASSAGVSSVAVAVVAGALAAALGWWLMPREPSVTNEDPTSVPAVERFEDSPHGRAARPTPKQSETSTTTEPTTGTETCATTEPTEGDEPTEGTETDATPQDTETQAEPATPGGRPATPRSAEGLLERAQRQASEGRRSAAISTYERLVERFPQSREALAARVSLGRLELDRGRAKQALAHFDAYLAGSAGALVEEASYGRIRALRQLGRHEQELRSIEAFLADHTDSLYAARLRKRAEELRAP